MADLPQSFLDSMKEILGEDYEAFLTGFVFFVFSFGFSASGSGCPSSAVFSFVIIAF